MQLRLTGKPALGINLSLEADAHSPYVLTSGPEQKSAKHATVFQRVKSIDESLGLQRDPGAVASYRFVIPYAVMSHLLFKFSIHR